MNKKTLEKMLKILEKGNCLSEKDYKYMLERIQAELERKGQKKETDTFTGEVMAVLVKNLFRFKNPVAKGVLAKQVKEVVAPYLQEKQIDKAQFAEIVEFYLTRQKGWLYEKRDLTLFVRFLGEVIEDFHRHRKGGKPSYGVVVERIQTL